MGDTNKRRLTGAALIVMSSTIFSRISGYLREALISNKLGPNQIGDAYNAAFLVPDLMYQLLLGGALAAALIPILSGYIEKKEEEDGWKVVGTFVNVTIITMVIFCVAGMIFTPQVISLVAKGFHEKDMETQLLAIKLTRILFPSVGFLMLAGICNGILNSYHRFAAAAYGPVIYNMGGVLALYLFGSQTSRGAERVAYGVLLSAIVYFLFQLAASLRNLRHYRPQLHLSHPGFTRMIKLAIPSLLSSSIMQVNFIISSRFATFASVGSLTLFNNANRIWQLPLGIFAQSVGIAMMPTMSARLAVGDVEEFRNIAKKGMKAILLLSMPSAVAIVVLREPIVRTLFKFSSSYGESQVATTGYILMFFSIALVAQSIQAIMGRAFYAANDTKTPLYVGLVSLFFNYLFSFILYKPMGVAGMALANSISSVIYSGMLIFLLNRKMKGIGLNTITGFALKILFASLVMGLLLLPINGIIPVEIETKWKQVLYLGIEVTAGVGVYFAVALLLGVEEAKSLLDKILIKFKLRKTA